MHPAAYRFVAEMVRDHKLNKRSFTVCEIGSYDVNGTVRPLFDEVKEYTGVDVRGGRGVDVVADGAEFGEDAAYDVVVTTETLEHCEHWQEIIANAERILKPGGALIVTAAGPERGPHGVDGGQVGKEAYVRIQPDALTNALKVFAKGDGDVLVVPNKDAGDVYAFAVKAKPKDTNE